jgi:hypothetical protein
MWTAKFWKETAERAIKSFCQGLLVVWAGDVALDITQVDFKAALGLAAMYAVISVLTSVVTSGVGPDKNSPSAV